MPMHQPKFLTKLKASADTKRDALDTEQKALDAERDTKREELAKLVKDSSDKNRQFFALYLGLWVYVLLMVFSTTDQMLLVPTQGIKLPLIDVSLPLLGFYVVAPLLLLAIHFNLLQNLESHHFKLMRWREACGGEVPRHEILAFLFDFEWLERDSKQRNGSKQKNSSEMEGMLRFVSRILFLHSGPFALGILLWRFTDYQYISITYWHLLALIVDSYLVWLTDRAFKRNEQPNQPSFDWPAFLGRLMGRSFGMLVLLQFGLACWFHFSTDGFVDVWSRIDGRAKSGDWLGNSAKIVKEKAPWLHSLFVPIISIDENEAAWLPEMKDIETQALLAGEKGVRNGGSRMAKDSICQVATCVDFLLHGHISQN